MRLVNILIRAIPVFLIGIGLCYLGEIILNPSLIESYLTFVNCPETTTFIVAGTGFFLIFGGVVLLVSSFQKPIENGKETTED
jgi:hypothetical protein